MTDARIGLGAEFWLDDAGDSLTQLDEVTRISLPNFQVEELDATHFGSTGGVREYVAGLTDPGNGDFEFNLVPGSATDLLLEAAKADRTVRDYEIIIPDGAFGQKFAGNCLVVGYSRDVPIDGIMKATVTVRFTGSVTITTLSS